MNSYTASVSRRKAPVGTSKNHRNRAVPTGVGPRTALVVAGTTFISISRLHQEVAILATLRVTLLLTALSVVLLMSQSARWKPKQLSRHWLFRSIAIITLVAIVGVPFGIYPGQSFRFLRDNFLRTLLEGAIVLAVARSPGGLRLMTQTVAGAGLTACALALRAGRLDSDGRLSGATMYDANDLALVANVTLPLLLWWYADKANRGGRVALALIPIPLWVLLQTGSRGGFLGLAATAIGFIIVGFSHARPRLRRITIAVAAVGMLSLPLVPSDYVGRMGTIFNLQEDYNVTSRTGRIAVWKRGIGYGLSRPVFGVGIDNFNTAEGRLSDVAQNLRAGEGFKWSTAHNSFVQLWAELGPAAALLFAWAVARLTWSLLTWRSGGRAPPPPKRSDELDMSYLAPLLGVSLVGLVVSAIFLSFAYYPLTYMMLGLAGGALIQTSSETDQRVRRSSRTARRTRPA